jgi:hypothetical protein
MIVDSGVVRSCARPTVNQLLGQSGIDCAKAFNESRQIKEASAVARDNRPNAWEASRNLAPRDRKLIFIQLVENRILVTFYTS